MRLTNNFLTQDGTVYIVDPINKTICGGAHCPTPQKYQSVETRLGESAMIVLENGSFFKTSPIQAFNLEQNTTQMQITQIDTRNSTYFINNNRMTISGGNLPGPIPFKEINFPGAGYPAIISLANGQTMKTSPVMAFKQEPIYNTQESLYDYIRN